MMLSEAIAAFVSNGVPVALTRFHEKQSPPFAEAHHNGSRNVRADDRCWRALCDYEFVLCAVDRDLALEHRIEDALSESEIVWAKEQDGWRVDDDLVTMTYRFEVYER